MQIRKMQMARPKQGAKRSRQARSSSSSDHSTEEPRYVFVVFVSSRLLVTARLDDNLGLSGLHAACRDGGGYWCSTFTRLSASMGALEMV